MRHSAGTWSGKTSEVPAFRLRLLAESTSQNRRSEWDTLSAEDLNRKPHPSFWLAGGTRFPLCFQMNTV